MTRAEMIDEAVRRCTSRYSRAVLEYHASGECGETCDTPIDDKLFEIRAEFRRIADGKVPPSYKAIMIERGPTVEETTAAQPDCPACGGKKWPEHICPKRPHLEQFLKQAHAE